MARQGEELAAQAARSGQLRASHADREQVIYTLKAAFVQGMLDKDDFDLRVGQTFAARTYAELAAVIADIPAEVRAARPPAPSQAPREQPIVRPGPVLGAATAVYGAVWASVLLLSSHGGDNPATPPLVFVTALVYLGIVLICVGGLVARRRARRSGGPPPQRPARGAGGRTFPDQSRRLNCGHDGHSHSTQAARGRVARPREYGTAG